MQYKPLQLVAYEYLKEKIINAEFLTNVIYSETKISKEIGVSRTPLRDAIHRLVQEKYIDIIPNKGFQLHKMNETDVVETYQVRSALEGYCTVQISKSYQSQGAQELFEVLGELLDKQQEVFHTTQSIEEFTAHDNEFHKQIISYVNNREFIDLFHNYTYRINRLAMISLANKGRMEETLFEHRVMLNTMKAGDALHIFEVTMRHMERPKDINLMIMHL